MDFFIQGLAAVEYAPGKINHNDRKVAIPVPVIVNVEPLKQPLIPLKNFLEGIEEQAFAKSARTG